MIAALVLYEIPMYIPTWYIPDTYTSYYLGTVWSIKYSSLHARIYPKQLWIPKCITYNVLIHILMYKLYVYEGIFALSTNYTYTAHDLYLYNIRIVRSSCDQTIIISQNVLDTNSCITYTYYFYDNIYILYDMHNTIVFEMFV